MSSLIEWQNRLPRVVVGMFNLRHNVRRDACPRLGGEKVGTELVGVEHEAAMTRARRCPAHLNWPCQWVLRRDVARLLVAGRAHAGGRRRAAYAIDRAAASERGDNECGRAGECCARRDAAGSPSHGGAILAVERRRLKGWRTALIGAKKERRSFGAPPPCAMSCFTPVRDDQLGGRETFRSLVQRSLHGCPQSGGVTRPRSLFYVALLRRGLRPWPGLNLVAAGLAAQSTLSAPPHGIAAAPKDRRHFALARPSAFSRPWLWTTPGLPCLVSFAGCFPVPSDFSAGTVPQSGPLTPRSIARRGPLAHGEGRGYPRYPPGRAALLRPHESFP